MSRATILHVRFSKIAKRSISPSFSFTPDTFGNCTIFFFTITKNDEWKEMFSITSRINLISLWPRRLTETERTMIQLSNCNRDASMQLINDLVQKSTCCFSCDTRVTESVASVKKLVSFPCALMWRHLYRMIYRYSYFGSTGTRTRTTQTRAYVTRIIRSARCLCAICDRYGSSLAVVVHQL